MDGAELFAQELNSFGKIIHVKTSGGEDDSDDTGTSGLGNLDERGVTGQGFSTLIQGVGEWGKGGQGGDGAVVTQGGFCVVSSLGDIIVLEETSSFFAIIVDDLDVNTAMVFGAKGVGAKVGSPARVVPIGNWLVERGGGFFAAEEDHLERM